MKLDAVVSKRLAFYESEETGGVLAPRGWHGFGTYGSMGSTLYVSPQHLIFDDLHAEVTGPVLIECYRTGETSGRMEVARVFARVFPNQKAYVESVKEAYPGLDLPFGPYPKDNLKYRSESIVEFRTPPHSEGLGSSFGLTPNDEPIRGVVISGEEGPSVAVLVVRLPPDKDDLTAYIIRQFERDESAPESPPAESVTASPPVAKVMKTLGLPWRGSKPISTTSTVTAGNSLIPIESSFVNTPNSQGMHIATQPTNVSKAIQHLHE
jgi:hypothetical protein